MTTDNKNFDEWWRNVNWGKVPDECHAVAYATWCAATRFCNKQLTSQPKQGEPLGRSAWESEAAWERLASVIGNWRDEYKGEIIAWLETELTARPQEQASQHEIGEAAQEIIDLVLDLADEREPYDEVKAIISRVQANQPPEAQSCTNCDQPMMDAMRFCSHCWNDVANKHTVAQAQIVELRRKRQGGEE